MNEALVLSVVLIKNTEDLGQKSCTFSLEIPCHFQGMAFPMIKLVSYFSPKRVCAQPLSIPHYRFNSFDSFKSLWQLVFVVVAVSFILNSFFGFWFQAETHTLWYDWMRPANTQLHADYMQRLTEAKARSKNKIRAVQRLVHRLRLVKSPAELERMQIAGKVTSQVWFLQEKKKLFLNEKL